MATLRDIAALVGVSTMTVSNVINGRYDKVSPTTVDRVLQTVREMDYVPNASARSLAAKRSNLIALVFPDAPQSMALANPHDSVFVGEVERHVSRSGRNLIIHSAESVMSTAANLNSWNVDGAILLGTVNEEVNELRERCNIPMVFVDNYSSSPAISRVGIDDYQGGYLAGRHLIDLGHTHLGFVGPTVSERSVVRERYLGFLKAAAEAGLAIAESATYQVDPVFEQAQKLAEHLSADPARPTGIFATADVLALGLVKGFSTNGIDVPSQVSIVGFDDVPEAEHSMPSLSTIRQDVPQKALASVEMLLRLMLTWPQADPERLALQVTLALRQTTAPPGYCTAAAG